VPQAPGEGFWQRVLHLAAAAGYVSGVDDLDPQFQQLVTDRIAAGNPEREDSPPCSVQAALSRHEHP
jgi:hypothetical protein